MKTLIYLLFLLTGLCASTKGNSSTFSRNEINPEIAYAGSNIRVENPIRINYNEPVTHEHNSFLYKAEDRTTTGPDILSPSITTSVNSITGVFYQYMDSPPVEYTIWADDLTSDLVITAISEEYPGPGLYDITISLDPEIDFATQITLSPDENGHIDITPVYVKISSSWFDLGNHIGSILHDSDGAPTITLPVDILCTCPSPLYIPVVTLGNIISPPETDVFVPLISSGFQFIANVVFQIDYNPEVLEFRELVNLNSNNFIGPICYDIVIIEISEDHSILEINLFPFTSDIWLSVPNGEKLFDLKFLFHTGTSLLNFSNSNYTLMWGCGLEYIDDPFEDYHHNGSVSQAPPPEITIDPPAGLGQDVEIYTDCGPPNSFTVSGTNLTSDLILTWEDDYGYAELCLTQNGTYQNSLTLPQINGSIGPTTVFVRLCMRSTSETQAIISFSSDGIYESYPVWNNMLPGNAPVTTIGNVSSHPGCYVNVPVTVVGFKNIFIATYQINYDPDVLVFQSVQAEGISSVYDEYISNDIRRLTIGLHSTPDYCWSVPDNDIIFTLVFQYNGGTTDLTFINPPGNDFEKCHYLLPNEEPFADFHYNGSVSQSPLSVITLNPPAGISQDVEIYTDCGPPNSFTIAGSNLTSDLTIEMNWDITYVNAEISLDVNSGYAPTLTLPVPQNGILATTTIFVRICLTGPCESQAFLKISGCGILQYYPVLDNLLPGNAPVASIADITAVPGDDILVPITVEDYDAIVLANFYIDYNWNALRFDGVNVEPDHHLTSINEVDMGLGIKRISIGFGSIPDYCISVPDHETLFELRFHYFGGNSDLTFVELTNNHFQKCCFFQPNEEPFEDFHQNGSVSEQQKKAELKVYLESLYDPAIDRMIKTKGADGDMFGGDTTDIVTVKLAQSEYPYPIVATMENVELKQDGSLSIQPPDSLNGSYYIIVSHRNSIDTWSAIPVEFNGYQITYDFTEDQIKAYGKNLRPNGGKYCIFTGDADHNGVVDTGDMTLIQNDAATFASGYLTTDINGDGIVDTYDMTIVDNNASNFVGVACPDPQHLPSVITSDISNISQTTANGGGHVYCSGGTCVTAHGVCWSTLPNPATSDNHTTDGMGTCVFTSNIFGLTPGTQYYLRAYATNGAGTAYGNEISFTTALVTPGNGAADIDNNAYTTLILGSQEWMAENLKTTRYANGDPIPNVTGNPEWSILETGAWCWYNNDSLYENPYGKLYNWHAVADSRNLCPDGWHVPSDAEWTVLIDYLGGANVADGKMKEAGFAHWNAPNSNADNSSGFTGLPGGSRQQTGAFSYINSYGYWWSSNEKNAGTAWCRSLGYNYDAIVRISQYKKNGISIRCFRQLSLPDTYTASVSGITETSAKGGGNILSDGGAPVDLGGICWSTSPNPTTDDNHTTDGSGTGAFISNITNLTGNTLYYVRAYATNSVGTVYGNEVSFRTLPDFECGSELTVNHLISGGIAPVDKTVTYGTINNLPGEPSKCWITSNLGSDHQAVAVDDPSEASAGWYWQFNHKQGYKHDGANLTPATWVTPINENSDWLLLNDPCKHELGAGWRIPTYTEWFNVKGANNNWNNWSDWTYAWNSGLKLHAAGIVSSYDGFIYNRGVWGSYWSSMQSSADNGWYLYFNGSYCLMNTDLKSNGNPLRCLRDNTGSGALLPVLTTDNISDITTNSANCGGNVTNDGGADVTAYGVCWSTSTDPTINNTHTTDGSGTGNYISTLTGLSSGTVYFVRAYATNRTGTEYGNEVSFTTQ